jgi:hypothetical protein
MDPGLLIAQVEHGPQMHGPALLVLMVFAVVAGLVTLVRRAMARKRSDRDRVMARDRDAMSDAHRGPVNDRGDSTRTRSGGGFG